METIQSSLNWLTQQLKKVNPYNPQQEAEIILQEVLEQSNSFLLANPDYQLIDEEKEKIHQITKERLRKKPLAYILGKNHFRSLILKVTPSVLIPRPETELLVEKVIDYLKEKSRKLVLADIGTGSGAIALSLAKEIPQGVEKIYAVDLSNDALEVAKINTESINPPIKPIFLQGNLLEPIEEKVDLIVANLPYIPKEELSSLPHDVKNHEPKLALDGGEEGLQIIKELLEQAKTKLNNRGVIFLEIHESQTNILQSTTRNLEYSWIQIAQDLTGRNRFAFIKK